MINNGNTGSAQVFLQSARDLAARLSRDGSPEAEEMVAEALALADTFRRWEIQRPENGARLGSIRQLMDLNRRAMDFLTQSQSGR